MFWKKCLECYEELLEGHTELVAHQCLQATFSEICKRYCQAVKVSIVKAKLYFVLRISEDKGGSKLAGSFLWKQDEETFFLRVFKKSNSLSYY